MVMRKILLFSALLFSTIVYAQTTISNGDWATPSIWNTGQVPANTDNVVIAHSVDIDNARTCANLTINSGARLDVDGALAVTGTLTNNGTFNVRNADLSHSGADFTNTGDVVVSAGYDIIMSNGSATLTNSGTVQLVSSSSLFAGLMLSGTYTKSGNGKIQYSRYISSTSYWDLIGSPVTNMLIEDFEANDDIAHNGTAMAMDITLIPPKHIVLMMDGLITLQVLLVLLVVLFLVKDTKWLHHGSDVVFTGSMNDGNVAITVTTNERYNKR